MTNAAFKKALTRTLKSEGRYSNSKHDQGGETYCGISRLFFPSWPGWDAIDKWKDKKVTTEELELYLQLKGLIEKFYKEQFWDRFQGDKVATVSTEIACELFDTSVNMNVTRAVTFLQNALNMQNAGGTTYPDIVVDGKLGSVTISTLQRYLTWQPGNRESNERILLNCMNGEQYILYKNNPQHEHFRGWFSRV